MSFIIPEKKLLFIHIPKTGGTSITKAFGLKEIHHLNLQYYEGQLKDKMERLEDYFKFTFVRNPYDRYASALDGYQDTSASYPQWQFIYDGFGINMNFIGKFENMGRDWKRFCYLADVKLPLPHLNGGKEHRRLTPDEMHFVESHYERDFKLFGYKRYAY